MNLAFFFLAGAVGAAVLVSITLLVDVFCRPRYCRHLLITTDESAGAIYVRFCRYNETDVKTRVLRSHNPMVLVDLNAADETLGLEILLDMPAHQKSPERLAREQAISEQQAFQRIKEDLYQRYPNLMGKV
jgi:hypothetical protein